MDDTSSFSSSAAFQLLRERAQRRISHQSGAGRAAGIRHRQAVAQDLEIYEVELDLQNQELIGNQEELEASRKRYFQHFDLAPVGMLRLDTTGLALECNILAATMLGVSRAQLKSSPKPLCLYLPHEFRESFGQHLQRAVESLQMEVCELVLRPLGRGEMPVRIQSVAHRDDSGPVELLVTLSDISELKRLEQERLKAARFETLGLLAGGLAHELNNVLQVIASSLDLGATRAALDAGNAADGLLSEYLQEAARAVTRASGISRRLLTFSKGGAPVVQVVNLSEVLGAAMTDALASSSVKLFYEIEPRLAPVEIDLMQVGQAIECLVTNAREAMAPAGGSVSIRARNLRVHGNVLAGLAAGDYVEVAVEDSGCGIAEEIRDQICDPYFTTKAGHSGLGLTTVVSILEKHRGALQIKSETGRGTCVSIFLRAAQMEAQTPVFIPLLAGSKGRRILFIDDEETLGFLVQRMLAQMNYDCVLATDGTLGCRLFDQARALGRPFDVVILDATIPGGIGGLQALRLLQAISPDIKAILCSGYSDNALMIDSKEMGFCARLQKPFHSGQLAAVLEEACSGD